jgi:hypothetical protein
MYGCNLSCRARQEGTCVVVQAMKSFARLGHRSYFASCIAELYRENTCSVPDEDCARH